SSPVRLWCKPSAPGRTVEGSSSRQDEDQIALWMRASFTATGPSRGRLRVERVSSDGERDRLAPVLNCRSTRGLPSVRCDSRELHRTLGSPRVERQFKTGASLSRSPSELTRSTRSRPLDGPVAVKDALIQSAI